jgi:hypothetical protein
MVHIIFTSKEKTALQKCKLPIGTTLVETNSGGDNVKSWCIEDTGWIMVKDWIEHDRDFTTEEEKEFIAGLTKTKVVDFFINHRDGNVPQREYSAYSDAEYKYFKYIHYHNESFEHKTESRNIFSVAIPSKVKPEKVKTELYYILKKLAKANPTWNPIYIDVLEDTLSEYGIYYVLWHRKNNTFALHKRTYGRDEILIKDLSLLDMIKYLKQHHSYE